MIEKLQITKTRNVKTPMRGTPVAAGLDFYVPEDLTKEDILAMEKKTGHELVVDFDEKGFVKSMMLDFGQSACIPSGIKAKLPDGYCMEFHNKSGIACKRGLVAGSCLIDQDYEGEFHIDIHNVSTNKAVISAGDKIAQFVMYKVEYPLVEVVESAEKLFEGSESQRGEGAFGSTGVK